MTEDPSVDDTAPDIAEIFHVALRKGVDGPASTLTWNLIHFLPSRVMASFHAHVKAALAGVSFDAAALRRAALSWIEERQYDDALKGVRNEAYAFGAALKLHSTEDWTAIAQFARECGHAPEAAWDADARSHWTDGSGLRVRLMVTDDREVPIADGTIRLNVLDGSPITSWRVRIDETTIARPLADGLDAVRGIVDEVRVHVRAGRMARREAMARPEAAAAMEGIDLAPPLDPADPFDARVIAATEAGTTALLRAPCRVGGEDGVRYVLSVPDPAKPSGRRIDTADLGPPRGRPDRTHVSTMQAWIDDGMPGPGKAVYFRSDDDLLQARLHATAEDGSVRFRAIVRKVGEGERDLATRETTLPTHPAQAAPPL